MSVLQGKVLLASADMADANFAETVILVIEHADSGALGLVLNQPLATRLDEAVDIGSLCGAATAGLVDVQLHRGGPCPGPLMVLHQEAEAAQAEVLPGLFFSTEEALVQPLITETLDRSALRCFAGYAGWGPGQLEIELLHGSWVVAEAAPDDIYAIEGEGAWLQMFRRAERARLLSSIPPRLLPRDPALN